LTCDGESVDAYEGETVASALLASGRRILRTSPRRGEPRGMFCGMGVCFDCAMTIDGEVGLRACMTLVRDGMSVETGVPEHRD
jgi:sarcosine oxidase subunit alpha